MSCANNGQDCGGVVENKSQLSSAPGPPTGILKFINASKSSNKTKHHDYSVARLSFGALSKRESHGSARSVEWAQEPYQMSKKASAGFGRDERNPLP